MKTPNAKLAAVTGWAVWAPGAPASIATSAIASRTVFRLEHAVSRPANSGLHVEVALEARLAPTIGPVSEDFDAGSELRDGQRLG